MASGTPGYGSDGCRCISVTVTSIQRSPKPVQRRAKAAEATAAAQPSATSTVAGTQSLGRGLDLLRIVTSAGSSGLKASDVAQRSGLHLATALRLLTALVRQGFMARDPATKNYTAGPELLSMAFQAQHQFGLESRLGPLLDALADATGDVAYATIRAGDEAVCLARREGSYPIRALPIGPGKRRPLGVGAGSLSILTGLPDDEAEAIMQRNAAAYAEIGQSTTSIRRFRERAKRDGYALNDAEIIPGMVAIAMPIRSVLGRPTVGISVVAIESRMDAKRRIEVLALLQKLIAPIEPS